MCKNPAEFEAKGIVKKGYGAASGRSRYAEMGGSIRAQKPRFRERGFSIDDVCDGTINVDIRPRSFERVRALATLVEVKWHLALPAETFSFYDVIFEHGGRRYPALVYFPHPETKGAFNEQFPGYSLLEILCPFVEGLRLGDEVLIVSASGSIRFIDE